MMRELGNASLLPLLPAAKMKLAMLAAQIDGDEFGFDELHGIVNGQS